MACMLAHPCNPPHGRKEGGVRVYLDNCCYNRPFDDQGQLKVALESLAKLKIQDLMRSGYVEYVWSDALSYEASKNPFPDQKQSVFEWMDGATIYVTSTDDVISRGVELQKSGLKKLDALHLASAEKAQCDWFFTVDKGILDKFRMLGGMYVANPVDYVTGVRQ